MLRIWLWKFFLLPLGRKIVPKKLNQYQKYGVTEYVLIYPNERIFEQYILKNGVYGTPLIYQENDEFRSHIYSEFAIPMNNILFKGMYPFL